MNKVYNKNICAIVVTYNRSSLLLRCIDAVLAQTYKCRTLLIVDNASIDDTEAQLINKFSYTDVIQEDATTFLVKRDNVKILYVKKSKNEGGAGGFSLGLQIAHQMQKFDGFWIMDDDGYPAPHCLEYLIPHIEKYDYVMPASIDVDHRDKMSWPTVLRGGGKSIYYDQVKQSWGEVMEYIYPFNGSLMSCKLVDSVGYVDKRLFIWGDEYEHYWRCKQHRYNPITITGAKFYHPANKMNFEPILFGLIHVPYVDSKWKMICLARNYTYIYLHYGMWYKIPLKFLVYMWLFLVSRKFDWQGWRLYVLSVIDGFREDFTRHYKYLK